MQGIVPKAWLAAAEGLYSWSSPRHPDTINADSKMEKRTYADFPFSPI